MIKQQRIVSRMVEKFDDYMIVCDEKTDLTDLADFQRDIFGDGSRQISTEFTKWAYLDRPGNWLRFCERSGEKIGQQGAMNSGLRVLGVSTPAVWAVDLRVRPEWKMKGLGVALIGTLLSKDEVVLALGISKEASNMFARQGWVDMGRIDSYAKPVSSKGLQRLDANSSPFGPLIRGTLYIGLRIVDSVMHVMTRAFSQVDAIEEFHRFDVSFEHVIDECSKNSKVAPDHSVSFLNWRFVQCPLGHEYSMYKAVMNGEIVGFVVYSQREYDHRKKLFIDDLVALPGFEKELIDFVISKSYEHEVDAIYYQGLDMNLSKILRRRLFVDLKNGNYFMFHVGDNCMKELLAERGKWRVSFADSDIGF